MKNNFTFQFDAPQVSETVASTPEKLIERITCGALVITREVDYYPAYGARYERHFFENTGDTELCVGDLFDLDASIPLAPMETPTLREITGGSDIRVIRVAGMVPGYIYPIDDLRSAEEYALVDTYLSTTVPHTGERSFGSLGGRSSDVAFPLFQVDRGGSGFILFLGWTGDWKASFKAEPDSVHVRAGLKNNSFILKPGDRFMTVSTLILDYTDGEKAARNRLRRLLREHFSTIGQNERPAHAMASFELWGALASEEMIRRIDTLKSRGIALDYIWLDAGWYGSFTEPSPDPFSGAWYQYTGDWRINANWHPDLLQDVTAHTESASMRMELWIEPERCVVNSPVVKAHPEWFTIRGGNALVDFGNPDAWQYVYETVATLIEELHLGCYRQDFNTDPDSFWSQDRTPGEAARMEIAHINGLWKFWDALLKRFPDLIIDNCSSGGRRIDLESIKRTIPFFRSDYQCAFHPDPDVTQCHNSLSEFLPYNGCTTKVKSDNYAVRSTFSSAWGLACWNTGFQEMSDADLDWAAKITKEYNLLRPYFSCDYYSLASQGYDKTSWVVWQYDRPEENDGVILAFRRADSSISSMEFDISAAKPGMRAVLTDLDSGETWTLSADEFAHLTLRIPEKRMSRIILYHFE